MLMHNGCVTKDKIKKNPTQKEYEIATGIT